MAGDNSFMTGLLALLEDTDFFEDVASQPVSGTNPNYDNDYLILVKKLLDLEGDQDHSNGISFSQKDCSPLSSTINELCCQITCEALNTNDARQAMKSLFKQLSPFSWDAKAVLTLLAFSVYYAENQHLAKIEQTDNKLGWVAFLRGRWPGISAVQGLTDLIRVTWEFTKCAVDFANDPKNLLWPLDNKRTTFYRITVGVIGCSVAYSGMISGRNDFLGLDVSPFSNKIKSIYESFNNEMENLKRLNEEKRLRKTIKHCTLSGTSIVELITVLFCTEDKRTIYHCSKKTMVGVEALTSKSVMLLISNLKLSSEDLEDLKKIYDSDLFQSNKYEIIWVPMVQIDDTNRQTFDYLSSNMKWYACQSGVSETAKDFIKKKWKFSGLTQVVVLNQKGRVENFDAMAMIRIWKIDAFPFKEDTGKVLWRRKVTSWLKLLVKDTVFPDVGGSIDNGQLVLLCDSAEDTVTIGKIEAHLKLINDEVSKIEEQLKQTRKRVSFVTWAKVTNREKFLTRLDGFMSLKMQESPDVYDSQTEDLVKLYTSYKHNGGFAILARGSSVVINARLTDLEEVLSQYAEWIGNITTNQTVDVVVKAHYEQVIKIPCHRFYIPKMVGYIPENISCDQCHQYMKTSITFECCHGAHDQEFPTYALLRSTEKPMKPSSPTPSVGPSE